MRLREMIYTLNVDLPKLALPNTPETLPGTNTPGVRIHGGLTGLRSAAASLSKIPPLREAALAVLAQPFTKHLLDAVWMPHDEYNQLDASVRALRNLGSLLLEALRAATSPQQPNVVSIRLPHPESLAKLDESLNLIKLGIEHPVALLIGASLKFDAFDTGTEWIDLLAGADVVVGCILGLWWAALRVEKKRAEVSKTWEEARSVTLDNNHKEVVDGTFRRLVESAEKQIVDELLGKCAPDKKGQPEVTAKVLVALGALNELRKGGGTIVPSLTAPKEIQKMSNEIEAVPPELPPPPAPPLLPERAGEDAKGEPSPQPNQG